MPVPIGSTVIIAWDAEVGGIECRTNVENGVVCAHTDYGDHRIRFDNPETNRKYGRCHWPLSLHERGRTWDYLIVIDGMEIDGLEIDGMEIDGMESDGEENWNSATPTPTMEERMTFVLERPPSRAAAVHAMRAIHV